MAFMLTAHKLSLLNNEDGLEALLNKPLFFEMLMMLVFTDTGNCGIVALWCLVLALVILIYRFYRFVREAFHCFS